ncbi:hypothetical protein PCE1_002318 [Barthelona sp. PCE]
MHKKATIILICVSCAYLLVYFHRISPTVFLKSISEDMNITNLSEYSKWTSAYFFANAIGQLIIGPLLDGYSPIFIFILSQIISCLGTITIALTNSVDVSAVGRALTGFSAATTFIPALYIIERLYDDQFNWANTVVFTFGGLGAILSSTPLAILEEYIHWRTIMIVLFVISVFLLIFFVYASKNLRFEEKEKQSVRFIVSIKKLFSNRNYFVLFIWMISNTSHFYVLLLFLFEFIEDFYDIDDYVSWALTAYSSCLLWGSYLAAVLHKVMGTRVLLVSAQILGIFCVSLLYFIDNLSNFVFLLCGILAFVLSPIQSAVFSSLRKFTDKEMMGVSFAFCNLGTFIGAWIFQRIGGWIITRADRQRYGYQQLFIFVGGTLLFSTLISLLYDNKKEKKSIVIPL